MSKPQSKNPHAVALGRLGGKASAQSLTDEQREQKARKAATARKDALTPEQRSKIAKKAAKARWQKKAMEKPKD